jgi:hypothetical protein
MKKVIIILSISTLIFGCKKTSILKPNAKITCVWARDINGVKTFYKCAENQSEVQQCAIEIRNANNYMETVDKATCSECQ